MNIIGRGQESGKFRIPVSSTSAANYQFSIVITDLFGLFHLICCFWQNLNTVRYEAGLTLQLKTTEFLILLLPSPKWWDCRCQQARCQLNHTPALSEKSVEALALQHLKATQDITLAYHVRGSRLNGQPLCTKPRPHAPARCISGSLTEDPSLRSSLGKLEASLGCIR